MPYKEHTDEFVKNAVRIWNLYYSKYHVDYKLTQQELVKLISKYYNTPVSVKTVKEWVKGNRLERGFGIGMPRGGYNKIIIE
jgi:hypothetical protein